MHNRTSLRKFAAPGAPRRLFGAYRRRTFRSSVSKWAWSIAYPVMLGGLGQNVISMVDTAFVGRLGEVELGAVGLAGVWYFILIVTGISLGAGLQIMVARRLGEKKPEAAGQAVDQALYLGVTLSVAMTLFLWHLSPPLYDAFTQSDAVYRVSIEYLDIRAWEVGFALLTFLLRGFYNGVGLNKVIIWSTAVMTVLNVVLDYALIFGAWGFPAMGVAGAAWASVMAVGAGFVYLVFDLFWRGYPRQYGFFRLRPPDGFTLRRLTRLSAPIVLQHFASMASFFFFMAVIEKTGEQALAVTNLVKNVYIAFMIVTWGFGSAVNTIVSNLMGQGKPGAVMPAVRRVVWLNMGINVGLAAALALFPEPILRVFTDQRHIIDASGGVTLICASCLLIYSAAGVYLNAVIGLGATRYALISEMIMIACYVVALLVVSSLTESLIWHWSVEYIYMVFMGGFSLFYLKRGGWRAAAPPQV